MYKKADLSYIPPSLNNSLLWRARVKSEVFAKSPFGKVGVSAWFQVVYLGNITVLCRAF
jgi:hypothetical protein